ncbi:hypothetical protein AVEN_107255-1 [Araneus ventricosus]|uniref:Uncharacterized protein n=1 Tax=Araneus ventricosus TaxID=182803 RepID=A0A4Y2SM17_ARAVE|nr:hypothetical protein AVEN_190037-1 [Araneus ventricosus]GBN89157.1 hypothetical protein AVEN_107255-1 [Araneus ventricosus]
MHQLYIAGLRFGNGDFQVRNPIQLKIHRVWCLLHVKSYVVAKRPPAGVVRKFGQGVLAQISSSSSDRGSNDEVITRSTGKGDNTILVLCQGSEPYSYAGSEAANTYMDSTW